MAGLMCAIVKPGMTYDTEIMPVSDVGQYLVSYAYSRRNETTSLSVQLKLLAIEELQKLRRSPKPKPH